MKKCLTAFMVAGTLLWANGSLALANDTLALATTSQEISDSSVFTPALNKPLLSQSGWAIASLLPIKGSLSITRIIPEIPNQKQLAPNTIPDVNKARSSTSSGAPVIIDNDEPSAAMTEQYQWQDIPDEPGKTHIQAGACFPVAVMSSLCSKTARVGDPVQARLKVDLNIGGKLIAHKGNLVVGHVSSTKKARRLLISELTPNKQWFRAGGSLGLQFDEIINDAGEHLPLVAQPSRNARIVKNRAEGRVLGINYQGEIAPPLSTQLKGQALHLAIRLGASAAGVFSLGAVPVAYGIIGAIQPDFAFMQSVGLNVRHRRLKGALMGVVDGLPAGGMITDYIVRGPEATIKPGDEFLAEFKQDFTGQAATEAQLLPGAKLKVHGQIVPEKSTPARH